MLGEFRAGQLSLFLPLAVLAVSLDLVWGYSGILSLGQLLAGNDYSWPRAIGATARAVIERMGGHVAGEGYLPLGSQSFEPALTAIQRSGDLLIPPTTLANPLAESRAVQGCRIR